MKVLLDENLDHRLRNHHGKHEVFTASYKGWDGLKNGKLLETAENGGIDVLVTGERNSFRPKTMSRSGSAPGMKPRTLL